MTDSEKTPDQKTEDAPEVEAKLKPKRKRRWTRYSGLIFAGLVVLFILLQGTILRFGIKYGLEELGFKNVQIETSDSSVAQLLFGIGDVSAEAPDGTVLQLGKFSSDFSWEALFDRHIQLEQITLSDLRLEIARDEEGRYLISGLPIPTADTESVQQVDDSGGFGWTIGAQRAEITNSVITYRENGGAIEVDVSRLIVEGFEGRRPREHTKLDLTGQVNGSPISLAGTVRPLDKPMGMDLKLSLDGFDLTALQPLVGDLMTGLSGRMTMDFRIVGEADDADPINTYKANWSGALSTSKLTLTTAGQQIAAEALSWTGAIVSDHVSTRAEGVLSGSGSTVKADGHSATLGDVKIDLKPFTLPLSPDGTLGTIDWLGGFEFKNANVTVGTMDMAAGDAVWQGQLVLPFAAGADIGKVAGTLTAAKAAFKDSGMGLSLADDKLTAKITMDMPSLADSGPFPVKLDFDVEGGGLTVSYPAADITAATFGGFTSKGNVALVTEPAGPTGTIDAGLNLSGLSLKTKSSGVNLRQEALTIEGSYTLSNQSSESPFSAKVKLNGKGVSVGAKPLGIDKVAVGNISFDGRLIDPQSLNGALSVTGAAMAMPGLGIDKLDIGQMAYNGGLKLAEANHLDGNLSAQKIAGAMAGFGVQRVAFDKLDWAGDLSLSDRTTAKGKLTLGGADAAMPELGVDKIAAAAMTWSGNADLAAASKIDGTVSVGKLSGAMPKLGVADLSFDNLSWTGNMAAGDATAAKGKLALTNLAAKLPDYGFSISQQKLDADADVKVRPGASLPIAGTAKFNGRTLTVDDSKGAGVLRLDGYQVNGLTLKENGEITSTDTRLDQVKALAQGESGWLVQLTALAVQQLVANVNGDVGAGSVTVSDLKTSLVRTKQGLQPLTGNGGDKSNDDTALPKVHIGNLVLTGRNQLTFRDSTTDPAVKFTVSPLALTLKNVDTGAPNKDMSIALKAGIGEFTKVDLNGTARPFAKARNAKMALVVEGLDLPTFSPYAAQFGAIHFKTGRLDANLAGNVSQDNIKAELKTHLAKVTLEQLEPREIKLSKKASVPLETALNLLRDDDGDIRLTVPIEGKLSDPNFKLDQVIGKAVGNAVFSALKVVFPPTLLLSALSKAGKGKIGFPPVTFPAGVGDLAAEQQKSLKKLAGLMRKRPAISLSVCGVATATDLDVMRPDAKAGMVKADADAAKKAAEVKAKQSESNKDETSTGTATTPTKKPAAKVQDATVQKALAKAEQAKIREALSQLAGERGAAVKNYLVKSSGIRAKRLFECRPKVELKGKGAPRVELSL